MSHAEEKINEYTNCFYICCFCNFARGVAPSHGRREARRLLNPCDDVWAQHFVLEDDQFEPLSGNPDVAYTRDVYALDDPRKIWMRRQRRILLQERLSFIERGQKARDRLLEQASHVPEPGLVDAAMVIDEALRQALRDIELFAVIPQDAKVPCSCRETELCEIPSVLAEQTIGVPSIGET